MKCPHLAGNYMFSCSARREVYIPSAYEFAEYCDSARNDPFKICRYYVVPAKETPPQKTGAADTTLTAQRRSNS